MKDLKGKTVFITGAASGIGLGMARAFGREGMNVVVADIDRDAARSVAERLAGQQIKAAPAHVDVADRGSVRAAALHAIAVFGKVHIVCNNAGVAVGGPLGTVSESDWEWILDVNLKGVVYGTEVFAPLIRGHGEGGHFVNTASLAGMVSMPRMEPYSATKFAVVAMSEGWAQQLAEDNVGMSILCPGYVRTRIFDSGRARQTRYGGRGEIDSGVAATQQQAAEAVKAGIDPDIVGARVVEAVKGNELYVFTHPNFRPIVEMRLQAIRDGFDAAERSEALKAVKEWAPVPSVQPPAKP